MVFSSARYPGGGDDGFYQDMFTADNVGPEMSSSLALGRQRISEKVAEFSLVRLPSKLQFYSCQVRQEEEAGPGLGAIPGRLRSASSLTVYNTALCPYTTRGDTAGQAQGPSDSSTTAITSRRKAGSGEAGPEEPENVSALQGGSEAGGQSQAGLLYFPEMGDLPDFDLPDDLELPNIATDLQVRRAGKVFAGEEEVEEIFSV